MSSMGQRFSVCDSTIQINMKLQIISPFMCLSVLLATTISLTAESCNDNDRISHIESVENHSGSNEETASQNIDTTNTILFVVKNVQFRMVSVEGGSFTMGSSNSDANSDQKPAHKVTVSDFYIGQTEVTQDLWRAVMGSDP